VTDYPLLLKRNKAAELVGVSDDTFADWVKKGLVPADCMFRDPDGDHRITWFRRDPLIAWAAQHNERQTA
jgi:predicted site-specific integrase-resolvase